MGIIIWSIVIGVLAIAGLIGTARELIAPRAKPRATDEERLVVLRDQHRDEHTAQATATR